VLNRKKHSANTDASSSDRMSEIEEQKLPGEEAAW
jgi:hypothetical protein